MKNKFIIILSMIGVSFGSYVISSDINDGAISSFLNGVLPEQYDHSPYRTKVAFDSLNIYDPINLIHTTVQLSLIHI